MPQLVYPNLQKPFRGAQIDWTHPLSRSLYCFYPFNDGGGPYATELVHPKGVLNLPVGVGTWQSHASGGSLDFNGSNAAATSSVTIPTSLQIPYPMTVACGLRNLGGTQSAYAGVFGMLYGTSNSSPYSICQVQLPSSATCTPVAAYQHTGSNQATTSTSSSLAAGVDSVFIGTVSLATSGNVGVAYIGPNQTGTTTSTAATPPTYTAQSCICLGPLAGVTQSLSMAFYWAAIWNRVLSSAELKLIGSGTNAIWQMFRPQIQPSWLYGSSPSSGGPFPWFLDQSHCGGFWDGGL